MVKRRLKATQVAAKESTTQERVSFSSPKHLGVQCIGSWEGIALQQGRGSRL